MARTSSGSGTPAPAATDTSEPAPTETPPAPQEPTAVEKQLTELTEQLSKTQEALATMEKAKNEEMANKLRYEAMYKGLQNQATKTLQKAAEDRKVFEQNRLDRAELAEIKESLSTITSHLLDDNDRKELEYRQRELKLKLAEQAIQEAKKIAEETQAAQTAASPQSFQTPEEAKAQFVSTYFPGEAIDPTDSRIDWANDTQDPNVAFQRFIRSVMKIKNEQDLTKTQDVVAQLKAQNQKILDDHEAKIKELVSQSNAALEEAKKDAQVVARKESEKRLRQLGADVPGSTTSDGARKTFKQQVDEEIPDNLAYKDPKEFQRRIEVLGKQLREGF